jgi:nucleoside-diphosphate-sugar epimerase
MKTVVVTGASGFVGLNLSSYLRQNEYQVKEMSLRAEHWQSQIDQKAQSIVHLAGKAHDTKNVSDPASYFKINTELTIELFDIFLSSDIQDFVYFSSVKAVADTFDGVLTEDSIAFPLTPYGQSKWEAEKYILSKKITQGKRVFIIRPCMIHGPGNKGNLNLLFNFVKKGIPYPLASFNNERSFLSIDNLTFLIKCILEKSQVKSGIYNFSDDEIISTNELVQIISSVIGKKHRLLKIPKWQVNIIARFGDMIKLPINSEKLKKLTENYRVSNNKIKAELAIKKLPFTAQQGLKMTIKSF